MSTVSPNPIALVANGSVQVPYPVSGQFGSVVLSNLSDYLLEVVVSGDIFWLAPWTAQLYALANNTQNPISAKASQLPGTTPAAGAAAALTATWYLEGEQVQGIYPQSLTANAIAAAVAGTVTNQQAQQLLGSIAWSKAADASASYAIPVAAQSLMLLLSPLPNAGSTLPCKVTVVGNTTGIVYFNQVIAMTDWELCPVSPIVDANVTVTCVGQGGMPINPAVTLYVVARIDPALVELTGVVPGYETNRYQPVIPSSAGAVQVATYTALVNGTLLSPPTPPPVYPNQYRLWSASIVLAANSATGAGVWISETGGALDILQCGGYPANSTATYLGGLILPAGVGLVVGIVGVVSLVRATVTYDIMSTA